MFFSDKHKEELKVNEQCGDNGNTVLHEAVLGEHLPIVQILISRFGKELDLKRRNLRECNALDIAIQSKNMAIIRTLTRQSKPEISSLIEAIKSNQIDIVQHIFLFLKSSLEKYSSLIALIERFIAISREVCLKSTPRERKKMLETNLRAYPNRICDELKLIASNANFDEIDDMNQDEPEEDCMPKTIEVEDILSEFECPICMHLMVLPRRIYACTNDHWICSFCLDDSTIQDCPSCREDFKQSLPHIRHSSEKLLHNICKGKLDSQN